MARLLAWSLANSISPTRPRWLGSCSPSAPILSALSAGLSARRSFAIMAKDRRADRPADKADKIGAEGEQDPSQRGLVGEIEFAKDQASSRAIKKEVVPLDRRADRRRNHCLAQLRAMFG